MCAVHKSLTPYKAFVQTPKACEILSEMRNPNSQLGTFLHFQQQTYAFKGNNFSTRTHVTMVTNRDIQKRLFSTKGKVAVPLVETMCFGHTWSLQALFNGYDLSTNEGIHGVIREIDTCRPKHVWMSPLCGPYSVMQNINQRDEKQIDELQEKRKHALRQYVGCALIFTYCVQRGIHVSWEWSQSCQAWRLPLIQNLTKRFQPYFAVVRGCRVGLTDKNGQVISKGWKIMTTHQLVAKRMNLPCNCPHGTQHVKCEGSLTGKTAYYTDMFAKRVCDAILQGHEEIQACEEIRGTSNLPELFGLGIQCECHNGSRHEAQLSCGTCVHHQQSRIHQMGDKGKGEHDLACAVEGENPNMEIVPQRTLSQEQIRKRLYLLHSSTGHGPIRHLIQALRRHGVDPRSGKI